jgi:hypothetical protein
VTALPDHELQSFMNTVFVALCLADDGRVLAGWRTLREGLELAEAARDCDEPWAHLLVARYRIALRNYTRKFGEKLLGPAFPCEAESE